MTDRSYEPLPPDVVDELSSALVDDEFDAAARDLGFDPAEARARLDATPGAAERLRALERARDALADAPELDTLRAGRMVRRAVDEAARPAPLRSRQRTRWVVVSSVVAVAAAIVVALVFVGGSWSSSSKNSSASK